MKALSGTFNQEKALVRAFSVIVKPMEHYKALSYNLYTLALLEADFSNSTTCWRFKWSWFILDTVCIRSHQPILQRWYNCVVLETNWVSNNRNLAVDWLGCFQNKLSFHYISAFHQAHVTLSSKHLHHVKNTMVTFLRLVSPNLEKKEERSCSVQYPIFYVGHLAQIRIADASPESHICRRGQNQPEAKINFSVQSEAVLRSVFCSLI